MKKVNRKRMNDEAGFNVWRSYSDMMSGLLLLFVLIMAVGLMEAQKNYNDKLKEQASRAQTQTELAQTQDELTQREKELQSAQQQLNQRESELEEKTASLSSLQTTLDDQASQLKKSQQQVSQQESELEKSRQQLATQESELQSRDDALAQSQKQLDEANALMKSQQEKIDQIVGVKADLIAALNDEFKKQQIVVNIDSQTGAIVLDANVMFDWGESTLTGDGEKVLSQVLPVYCSVLLSDQYADYVAEVIIDGYTDSSGDYLTNLALSQNRAYAVASYLLSNSGSFLTDAQNKELAQKLTANGRSQSNLVLDQNGNEDAQASRRVEIKFRLKDEEMIAELSKIIADTKNQTAQTDAAAQTDTAAQTDAAGQTDAAAQTNSAG